MATRGIFEAQRFVTSEAVEVELPAAQVPTRMVSGIIDLLLVAVGVFLLVWLVPGEVFAADAALGQVFVIVVVALVMAGVPITLETLTRGRTVGKMVMGLRTVRDDTGPIGPAARDHPRAGRHRRALDDPRQRRAHQRHDQREGQAPG
ncbi:RDD family protein [Serinicoccus marinus]|uniref:RDD family protein n=1 Tax=Serinicoccus marinus TaxID=247333 RepID=UPI00122E7B3F|nr:RDD family protein [Serinicoccus marinus]